MMGLKMGSKGAQVKKMQAIIGASADGIFGPNTDGVLKNFQKAHGLKATGVVDAETLAALQAEEKREVPSLGKRKTIRLGIIIGHTKKAQGAVMVKPYSVSEYNFNTEIAEFVRTYSKGSQVEVYIYTRDVGGVAGAYGRAEKDLCDAVIELHFNSTAKSQDTAAYSLTLVSADSEDKIFGQFIQDSMSKAFGRTKAQNKALSVLGRGARGSSNVHSFKGPNCLVEPFFGNNPAECKMAMDKKMEYAKSLFMGAYLWAESKGLV